MCERSPQRRQRNPANASRQTSKRSRRRVGIARVPLAPVVCPPPPGCQGLACQHLCLLLLAGHPDVRGQAQRLPKEGCNGGVG